MNRQDKWNDGKLVSRGIEWCSYRYPDGTTLPGFTANPVRGCKHGCQWEMPDGKIARCYAKDVRDRLDGDGAFENITWHPDVLEGIRSHKKPAGIFIDSMSDLFGQGVSLEWIDEVIKTIRDCPQHIFFSLTKNPSRFRLFSNCESWPSNWLVGISYPPTFMFGHKLTLSQQAAWLGKALESLIDSPASVRWVSVEPLSVDLSPLLSKHSSSLSWAVIGAASNGSKTYQPDRETFQNTLAALNGCATFFKGNLDRKLADEVAGGWREEFPILPMGAFSKAASHKV